MQSLAKCDDFITNWDNNIYKVGQILQSKTIITKWIEKNPEQHNIFINQTYYLQKELKAVYCYALGIHLFILPIVIVYNSHLFHTCYWY